MYMHYFLRPVPHMCNKVIKPTAGALEDPAVTSWRKQERGKSAKKATNNFGFVFVSQRRRRPSLSLLLLDVPF